MMQPTLPGNLLRQAIHEGTLNIRWTQAKFSASALKGYLCATLWDWEQERKNENSGDMIARFTMEWQVPQPPTAASNQTIFLFNGLQPSLSSEKKAVLQPVLKWGNPDLYGEGPFWSVSSWFVRGMPGSLDVFVKTEGVRVEPGQPLKSSMVLTDTSDGIFYYSCEFSGIAGTALNVAIPTELVRVTTALEVYEVSGLAELPGSPQTTFKDVEIIVGTKKRAMPKWQVMNLASDTDIRVTTAAHGGIEDEITIYYR